MFFLVGKHHAIDVFHGPYILFLIRNEEMFVFFPAAGIKHFLISCRVTQMYDVGSSVYSYFAFKWNGVADPLTAYECLEQLACDEILASGGRLSHHRHIGKLRSKWFPSQVSKIGVELYQATKRQLDPKNIFANGNTSKLHS
jgi:alkyldihydroxyacetonephosphate synthase